MILGSSSHSSRLVRVAGGALVVLALARCSGGSSQNPPEAPTSTVIGTTGGSAASSDGSLKVSIPSGALSNSVSITVTPSTSPGAGALGTVYVVGPAGTTFAESATMTFSYQGVALGGQSPSALRVATYVAGSWQALAGYAQNTSAQTVSGTTTQVGTFALWAPPASSSSSSSGGACASVVVGSGCGSSSGSSSGGSSTGGSSSGGGCPASTCATGAATACAGAGYSGAAVQSCVDGAGSFTVNCCFAGGSPICFAMTGGEVCSGGSSSSGAGSSSGASSCTPETCAENAATMCAQYPGASMTSCTDATTGYQASCCFPAGKPVCVPDVESAPCSGSSGSSSSSGGGSGSSSGGITSCGPPPTCASSTPCGAYTGTTVGACTDSSTGYSATCCYPIGTLPPVFSGGSSSGSSSGAVSGGSSGASSGSSSGG